jgi:hypothetical protein
MDLVEVSSPPASRYETDNRDNSKEDNKDG